MTYSFWFSSLVPCGGTAMPGELREILQLQSVWGLGAAEPTEGAAQVLRRAKREQGKD